jgi:hypothetical protein
VPVAQQAPALVSPPTNIFGLVQYVAQRVPGYDFSEYLRELNSAYIHVWEEVAKLKNHYFTNIKTVSVTTAGATFDLLYNTAAVGILSAPLSNRLYQVTKIRVQPPGGGLFQATRALTPNEPDFISISANTSGTPTQTGPYYWWLSGRGNINWGLALAVGSNIEFTYTFWPLALTYLFAGTVSSAGVTVTGSGTNFTQLLQPDFQTAGTPLTAQQEEIQAELVVTGQVNGPNQIYRVATIASDTTLTTQVACNPVLTAGSVYVLAALPEIPREHIRVIAAIALAKMYSVAGDDSRVSEWTAISQNNLAMMKDSLIERQSNNPPSKQRFPFGIGRRNRTFLR